MGAFDKQASWSIEKQGMRLVEIRQELEKKYLPFPEEFESLDKKALGLIDEAIILLLAHLKKALQDLGDDTSPLEEFVPTYLDNKTLPDDIWFGVFRRFDETYSLVSRYKSGTESVQMRLRPQLLARGML